MLRRFRIAKWTSIHEMAPSYLALNDWQEIARLRNKLSRFLTSNPVVSIVIPVWNEEKNIVRTLSSFAEMNIPFPTELIIVDNNSTDRTAEILDMLGVKTIFEKRQGISYARLAGLRASRGIYQLCGDGDSLYPPDWIETMVAPLMKDPSITCVYGNYSFLPSFGISRTALGFYELCSEALFELRRWKREYLNVRGANFGFRIEQGLAVKGFEMSITRVYDNDEHSKSYVVFGEDGRMGRKLGELGKLTLVRSYRARIWTSSRRLMKDGSLTHAFQKRIKKEWLRVFEYIFSTRPVSFTTDQLNQATK